MRHHPRPHGLPRRARRRCRPRALAVPREPPVRSRLAVPRAPAVPREAAVIDPRRWLQLACTHLYLERVTVLGAEHLPRRGPALYVGLHRNGAIDGFLHRRVLHDPVFLISAQWTRGLSRLFLDGIPVVRDKDAGDRSANEQSLQRCVEHLIRGGELSVFPEGTSALGPRHLPFRKGAAWILSAALAGEAPVVVIPIGLAYERAWEFRSRVEIVVGAPVDTRLASSLWRGAAGAAPQR